MGMDVLVKLVNKSHFPWVLSNVFDADTHKPLFDYETKVIVDINGVKVIIYFLFLPIRFFIFKLMLKLKSGWNVRSGRERMGLLTISRSFRRHLLRIVH